MSLNSKIKISLLSFGVLIGSAVFLIKPILRDIRAESGQLIAEKNNLSSLESKIKNLENFRQKHEELKPDLEKADSLLVQAQLPVDFIRFLEQVSAEADINLKISPGPAVKTSKDPWSSSNFQLALAGSYPDILQFVSKLQNGSYLMIFQNLNFSRLAETELKSKEFNRFVSGDVRGNISVKVYAK